MTRRMRLVELRSLLVHLISMKGKCLMVSAPHQKVKSLSNNVEDNICDRLNLLVFVLISPIINKKLAPINNGIKLPYTAVNRILIFACFVRNNKMHLESL